MSNTIHNSIKQAVRRSGDDTLKSMVKMMSVLECFNVGERQLTPSEIARRTKLPRATAHRIAASLRHIGLLDQDLEALIDHRITVGPNIHSTELVIDPKVDGAAAG